MESLAPSLVGAWPTMQPSSWRWRCAPRGPEGCGRVETRRARRRRSSPGAQLKCIRRAQSVQEATRPVANDANEERAPEGFCVPHTGVDIQMALRFVLIHETDNKYVLRIIIPSPFISHPLTLFLLSVTFPPSLSSHSWRCFRIDVGASTA